MNTYFKNIIDTDSEPLVICNLSHVIIYMNAAAYDYYHKKTGCNLMGKSLFDCHPQTARAITQVVDWFGASVNNNKIHTAYNKTQNKDFYLIALRDDDGKLIGYYEKHEFRSCDKSPFYNFYTI